MSLASTAQKPARVAGRLALLSGQTDSEGVAEDLKQLIENLRVLSERLEKGEGTPRMLVKDPEIHAAINDIIVGIDESRLLR